jgi:3',5'-nucleoside bisphosphate phosphatase
MKADLHVHSTASDGTLSPTALVERAHSRNVGVLALADHDTVDGLAEARQAADRLGIVLVNAVELSAAADGRDVHVLAYHVDPTSSDLLALLEALKASRHTRAEKIVAALNEAGFDVPFDEVLRIADGGSLGRSHIARALVGAGHAETIRGAFETLIGRGRPFYVPKPSDAPAQVVARVRELGGVPVLAHPGVTQVDDLIPEMVRVGLLGIEAYHADHTQELVERYAALAGSLDLLTTGGSDFHGPEAPNPDVGSIPLPELSVERLMAAAPKR